MRHSRWQVLDDSAACCGGAESAERSDAVAEARRAAAVWGPVLPEEWIDLQLTVLLLEDNHAPIGDSSRVSRSCCTSSLLFWSVAVSDGGNERAETEQSDHPQSRPHRAGCAPLDRQNSGQVVRKWEVDRLLA